MNANVRNVLIVLVLAALVALIPGGGSGANVAIQAVSLAFLASLAWFASLMYRRYRSELYALGDRRRALLYAALAVATVTLSATSRMWTTSVGELVWLALVGVCVYAVFTIVWAARKY